MPIAILKQRQCRVCGKLFIAEEGDVLPRKLPNICPECEVKQLFGAIGKIAEKIAGKEG